MSLSQTGSYSYIYQSHISMPTYKRGLTCTHILESYVMTYVS
ncbi:hypothetical protein F383_30530 [Gossypium arboreum]|uniref:Uncharacterized protein n=1 Tax=Gossypium arboreum TaxID=29729 RepID=A0A0B0N1F5_GOSAR|nr:hypothetical protein F383_30530 [Gossypium arboreum]